MSNQLAVIKTQVVDTIQKRVNQYVAAGELHLPADYSASNALKSAFLMLQGIVDRDGKPVLETCTQTSIHNSLYSMVVQGLNPEKKQCYFIAYGKTLSCQRSYFGAMALAKRLDPSIMDIVAEVVYNGDVLKFKIVNGRKVINDHEQEFSEVPRPIVAAYAIVIGVGGQIIATELMTIQQIHQSWRQSKQNPFESDGKIKPGSVHGKFPEEMAKRTVINKVCKPIINSSSDNAILSQVLRSAEQEGYDVEEQVREEDYRANANKQIIEMTPTDPEPPAETQPPQIDPETGEVIPPPEQVPNGVGDLPPFMQ